MKKILLLLLVLPSTNTFSQKTDCATDQFTISGAIKNQITVSIQSLDSLNAVTIPDVIITNHLGEKKSEATGLKGVLLKDILQKAEISAASPKQLSEYYFVFTACDGYKIVYSWNEIFNTETGNHIFIVTTKNGTRGVAIKEKILAVTTTDFKTGRRYIKGLASITVHHI